MLIGRRRSRELLRGPHWGSWPVRQSAILNVICVSARSQQHRVDRFCWVWAVFADTQPRPAKVELTVKVEPAGRQACSHFSASTDRTWLSCLTASTRAVSVCWWRCCQWSECPWSRSYCSHLCCCTTPSTLIDCRMPLSTSSERSTKLTNLSLIFKFVHYTRALLVTFLLSVH